MLQRVFLFLFLAASLEAAPPADPAELQRYSQEGETALAQRRYAEAEAAYEKLRQLSPQTAEIYGRLGLIYFQQRKFDQAIPILQQGLKLKPSLPNADVLLAMSLSEAGRYQEALAGLRKGFRGPSDPAVKRMAGLQLLRSYTGLQQDRNAVEVALELNKQYPDDPEVLYHSARLYGNFAFLTMRHLAEVSPSSSWKNQAAAEVHESQGNYDLALAAYRQVLAADPQRPGLHFRIGRTLLLRSRQPDASPDLQADAIREFEQELQIDPTNANAAYELGEMHRRAGRPEQAREAFTLALKHQPDFPEAHIGLARVLLGTNDAKDALPHLQRAIALNPSEPGAYFQLAQAYRALGNTAEQQKALAEFQRLRSQQRERESAPNPFSANEVTRQEIETSAAGPNR